MSESHPEHTREGLVAMDDQTPTAVDDSSKEAPSLEQVAFIATLDVFGIVFTAAAVAVLLLNDKAAPGWWVLVGMAAALSVVTTAIVVRLAVRRRERAIDPGPPKDPR